MYTLSQLQSECKDDANDANSRLGVLKVNISRCETHLHSFLFLAPGLYQVAKTLSNEYHYVVQCVGLRTLSVNSVIMRVTGMTSAQRV